MDKLYASARSKLAHLVEMEQEALDELVYVYVYSETAESVKDPLYNLLRGEKQELSKEAADFLEYFLEAKDQMEVKRKKGKKKKEKGQVTKEFSRPETIKCFCMATRHELLGNCLSCGKIACIMESPEACAFCGDSIQLSNPDGEFKQGQEMKLEAALMKRDILIKSDIESASKLSVLDEHNDWYELSKNQWLSQEERNYAERQVQKEKQIKEKMEEGINLKISVTGDRVKVDDDIEEFDVEESKARANEFHNQVVHGGSNLRNQTLKACTAMTQRMKQLHEAMRGVQNEEQNKGEVEATPEELNSLSSLSTRLQTENPFKQFYQIFAEFERRQQERKQHFSYDDPHFSMAQTDRGMCMSMHQPWASLLIHGFKRYEGRQWTTQYRGPLWIHSTSKKPQDQVIEQVEKSYSQFYQMAVRPAFPDRYPISQLLGCVDLVDVVPLKELKRTVPKIVREPSESAYQFVVRNPRYLVVPKKMKGQPGIYQMQEEVWKSALPGLRQVQTGWWPPTKFKFYQMWKLNPMSDRWSQSEMQGPDLIQRKSSIQSHQSDAGYLIERDLVSSGQLNLIVKQIKELLVNFNRLNFKRIKDIQSAYKLNFNLNRRPAALMQTLKFGLKTATQVQLQSIKQSVVLNQLHYYFIQPNDESKNMLYWRLNASSSKKAGLEPVGVFINDGNSIQLEITLQGGGKSVSREDTLEAGDMLLAIPSQGQILISVRKVLPERKNAGQLNVREGGALLIALTKN